MKLFLFQSVPHRVNYYVVADSLEVATERVDEYLKKPEHAVSAPAVFRCSFDENEVHDVEID